MKASKMLKAIAIVRKGLAEDWISDGCRSGPPTIGCVSCQMRILDQYMKALATEYEAGGLAHRGKVVSTK